MGTFTEHVTTTFVVIECGGCGVTFGLTERYVEERRNDHKGFRCPNGCSRVYNGKSEAEKLKERLAAVEGNLKFERECREREERSHSATKGQLTKARKRAQGGACPCCNRTFVQLTRHMATKHPDFVAEQSDTADQT